MTHDEIATRILAHQAACRLVPEDREALHAGIVATLADAQVDKPLTLERAEALNRAMGKLALESQGIGKCPWSEVTMLREASLAELVAAGPMIETDDRARPPAADGSRTFSIVCDDRMVAAIYAFLHYALPPTQTVDDEDTLILKLSDAGTTSFLICGVREARVEQDEDDQVPA